MLFRELLLHGSVKEFMFHYSTEWNHCPTESKIAGAVQEEWAVPSSRD